MAGNLLQKKSEWYVFFCHLGYEEKVKETVLAQIHHENMDDLISQIVILSENGEGSGRLLVEMVPDISAWHLIRNTAGVTGFVEDKSGPIPHHLSATPKR
jgi:transcription antitermination factor NusG